jgi:hypothetical protein
MKKIIGTILITCFPSTANYAQENEAGEGKIHKIAQVFGYTHVPYALKKGIQKSSLCLYHWSDYLLSIKREMELGVALDLELGNYLGLIVKI